MVSIIIPTYNRSHLIGETLESIINQSYPNWECIVVDDGSQDRTVDEVYKYACRDNRFSLYVRPKELPKGANSCRNYGLCLASGKYIKWLDSDDLLVSDGLFHQVAILEENRHINLCLGYSRHFDHSTRFIGNFWSRSFESSNYVSDHINNRIRWGVGDVLWRREWLGNSPFHNKLKNSQEWLMHGDALLTLDYDQIYNYKKVVCLIRRGHERMSSNRSSSYFANQVKARYLLIFRTGSIRKLRLVDLVSLLKQMFIYSFHMLKSIILDGLSYIK